MGIKKYNMPSVRRDFIVSMLVTVIIVSGYVIVYEIFGVSEISVSKLTHLFGAILALSGLMFKQYLLKEVIQYFNKFVQVKSKISEITLISNEIENKEKSYVDKFSEYYNTVCCYICYVKFEIKLVPFIPLILVILYGAALIGDASHKFSLSCLCIMIFLVSYLSQATITSNNIAIDQSDLDDVVFELDKVIALLKLQSDLARKSRVRSCESQGSDIES
jgi:hypothetical protein